MKGPISFEQFAKNPTMALFFLDNRINYTTQIEKCSERVIYLEDKIDHLSIRLYRSDSILARTTARLEILNEMADE